VTSLQAETGRAPAVKDVGTLAANHLAEIFKRDLRWANPRELTLSGVFDAGVLSSN
jgi:hypothetical protein